MIENSLRICLGRGFDHTEYCIWLASNAPKYGVLVKNKSVFKTLIAQKRAGKWKHSTLTKQVQLRIKNLDIDTQVLILLNASTFSEFYLKKIIRAWPSNKPLLLIG
jgi:hypothetical protein